MSWRVWARDVTSRSASLPVREGKSSATTATASTRPTSSRARSRVMPPIATRGTPAAAARHALALAAVRQLDGNASSQLTVEAMLMKMRSA